MTIYEKFETVVKDADFNIDNPRSIYIKAEARLVSLIKDAIIKAKVKSTLYGSGIVADCFGNDLENAIIAVVFTELTKKFSLKVILGNTKFTYFEDVQELIPIWDAALTAHKKLVSALVDAELLLEQKAIQEAAKLEEERRQKEKLEAAAAKFQKAKMSAIKEFDLMLAQQESSMPKTEVDDFYYSLGWIVKHLNRVHAAVPDYLYSKFEKHFGNEAEPYIYKVDTSKRTSGGYRYQWTLGLRMNFSVKNITPAPAYLDSYYNSKYCSIMNTSFVWDLIDKYGFQFGKKQDIEVIKSHIPADFVKFFEAGLNN